ncbi:MAG: trypsin-like peptidase domain-containing protein, partial [Actinomycetota bacterium]|nr:trypsin-like peptidase domain-containing protein [Actinomycetota bacterium]
GLQAAALARSGGVRQGETVVALGFPGGAGPADELTSTTGVVSVSRTTYRDTAADVPVLPEVVQTDSALNPGNSGGPLVDLDGRIVGMNAVVRSASYDGRALQNQNYAIAADRLRAVVARLRDGRSAGWTGLTFSYPTAGELAARRLPAGLLVTGTVHGTPAARAGIDASTEALVGVDGRPVGTTLSSLCAAVGDSAPSRLTFARPGGAVRDIRLG